jgi:hypothetical protein
MKQLLFAGIAFLLLAISCNQANEKESIQSLTVAEVNLEAPASDTTALAYEQEEAIPGDKKPKQPPKPASQSPESRPDWNKKIIKTATLNVEVKVILLMSSKQKLNIKLKIRSPLKCLLISFNRLLIFSQVVMERSTKRKSAPKM